MEPPKLCPDCKTYHHPHQAHVWNNALTENVAPKKAVRPKSAARGIVLEDGDIGKPRFADETTAEKVARKKPFDRKAYQRKYMRDYMRKYRAKERGE